MKNKILILFLFCGSMLGYCQKNITWEVLAQVKFTEKYFEEYDDYFEYPEFLAPIKDLEGKEISITGYFLNVDPEAKIYILSKGPMASCFFCGQGGPETAIELQFFEKPSFKTDDLVEITGVLKLNKDDVEHFNYILKDCSGVRKK